MLRNGIQFSCVYHIQDCSLLQQHKNQCENHASSLQGPSGCFSPFLSVWQGHFINYYRPGCDCHLIWSAVRLVRISFILWIFGRNSTKVILLSSAYIWPRVAYWCKVSCWGKCGVSDLPLKSFFPSYGSWEALQIDHSFSAIIVGFTFSLSDYEQLLCFLVMHFHPHRSVLIDWSTFHCKEELVSSSHWFLVYPKGYSLLLSSFV